MLGRIVSETINCRGGADPLSTDSEYVLAYRVPTDINISLQLADSTVLCPLPSSVSRTILHHDCKRHPDIH
jgi:hypothetical protein